MNTTTAIISIIGIFALLVVAAFIVYRWRSKIEIKAPFGLGLKISSSNEIKKSLPAVNVEDVKSRKGGIVAEDNTGRGAQVKKAEVDGDILVSSSENGEQKK